MRIHDSLLALLLIALAVAIGVYARGFPPMPGQGFGPAFFPTLIAAGLLLAALVMLGSASRRRRSTALLELDDWVRSPRKLAEMLLLVGGVLFYILLSESLGYLLAAPVALLMFLVATRVRMLVAVPVALFVPLLIHYIFYSGLRVPLPWGILVEHAW
jgi:putative tricarboxylic transport membrane protein